VPDIRAFRALRYDPSTIPDLSLVVAPPYDVIGRTSANGCSPCTRPTSSGSTCRSRSPRRARRPLPSSARVLAAWRSDGTLHKDPHPSIYVYEQTYRVPGTEVTRTQRGFFARIRLEAYGPGSGVLPHERTMSGPREDRYKLLRATGVNTSPVVGLYDDTDGAARPVLDAITARTADVDLTDEDGTRHRLWAIAADGDAIEVVAPLLAAAARGPVTIADGHHRYETALRYRDERRMTRSCEEDPAFDYVLMLLVDGVGEPLTVLPTHRIVGGLGETGVTSLLAGLDALFSVRSGVSAEELRRTFGGAGLARGGEGRFGIWTRAGGALLSARREAFEPYLPSGGAALRGSMSHSSGSPSSGWPGSTRTRSRPGPSATRIRPTRPSTGSMPAWTPPTRHSSSTDARGVGLGGGPRRRRDAPEIDLLLSEGSDRPRHQPSRMVNRDARNDS